MDKQALATEAVVVFLYLSAFVSGIVALVKTGLDGQIAGPYGLWGWTFCLELSLLYAVVVALRDHFELSFFARKCMAMALWTLMGALSWWGVYIYATLGRPSAVYDTYVWTWFQVVLWILLASIPCTLLLAIFSAEEKKDEKKGSSTETA